MKDKRQKSEEFFSIIFENAEKVMEALDVTIRIPRLTKMQTTRPNYPTSSNDEKENIISYWNKTIYIATLDFINADLKDRFSEESMKCYALNFLIPVNLEAISKLHELKTQIEPICHKYYTLLCQNRDTMPMKVLNEICSLKKSTNYEHLKKVKKAMEAYSSYDEKAYPLLKSLLQILLSLPISAATAERSFSTLRRLKTWMRSRMTQDRLNGLGLVYVHRDINVNIENVINRYANLKNRRIEFVV